MKNYTLNTPQTGLHKDTLKIATKHAAMQYQRPISPSQHEAFAQASAWVKGHGGPVILDSGCGRAKSTRLLAEQHPDHFIFGIDKSEHRLSEANKQNENWGLIQANLQDLWRLIKNSGWKINKHYLLYPNPWPKPKHLKRRFHGHPVFPTLLALSDHLIVRSNWETYLEELKLAADTLCECQTTLAPCHTPPALTHFEQKYWDHGVATYELTIVQSR